MKKQNLKNIILLMVILLIAASCMPGAGSNAIDNPAGFFRGIWHGWIAPISLIFGFFDPHISIYETYNTGWWYDLGFYMAIVGGFGGFSFVRSKSKKD